MENNERSVNAVLFDYGGVVAEEGFVEGLAAIARKNGIDSDTFIDTAFDLVHATGYLTGNAPEAVFWRVMREETGVPGTDDELAREILSRFVLRPRVLQLADELRSMGLIVGILSDQTNWLDRLNERDNFFRHFDRVFNSYHMGLSKRGYAVFDEAARRLDIPKESICFIDDNEGNCVRAREKGLKVIHYSNGKDMLRELARHVPGLDPSSLGF